MQFNLRTRDRQGAATLLAAKEETARQQQPKLQKARFYFSANAAKNKAFTELAKLYPLKTRAGHFFHISSEFENRIVWCPNL